MSSGKLFATDVVVETSLSLFESLWFLLIDLQWPSWEPSIYPFYF